jgi:predicted glycosyltransferase
MRVVALLNALAGHGHAAVLGGIFRALRPLDRGMHAIVVSGGVAPPASLLPDDVELVQLPALVPAAGLFGDPSPRAAGITRPQQRKLRRSMLRALFKAAPPDVLLVEHYPFGRRAFAKELDLVIADVRERHPSAVIVSSLSVLGGRAPALDPLEDTRRVRSILERSFELALVHTDPRVERLDDDYPGLAEALGARVRHTGYVLSTPPDAWLSRGEVRARLGVGEEEILVVAHAGGGRDGAALCRAALEAAERCGADSPVRWRWLVVGGSVLPAVEARAFEEMAAHSPRVRFDLHRADLPSCVAAADAVVCMCGYASAVEVCAAGVPALFVPRQSDGEQTRRAERLERFGVGRAVRGAVSPELILRWLHEDARAPRREVAPLDLDGARRSAEWLLEMVKGRGLGAVAGAPPSRGEERLA